MLLRRRFSSFVLACRILALLQNLCRAWLRSLPFPVLFRRLFISSPLRHCIFVIIRLQRRSSPQLHNVLTIQLFFYSRARRSHTRRRMICSNRNLLGKSMTAMVLRCYHICTTISCKTDFDRPQQTTCVDSCAHMDSLNCSVNLKHTTNDRHAHSNHIFQHTSLAVTDNSMRLMHECMPSLRWTRRAKHPF